MSIRLRRCVYTAAGACALHGCDGFQSALDPKSHDASMVAGLWWGMLIVGTLILIAVVVLLARSVAPRGSRPLTRTRGWVIVIVGGAALPMLSIVGLVVSGVFIGREMAAPERSSAATIEIVGKQWWWQVAYLDREGRRIARTANEIHVPVGRSVRLLLKSDNVIHSFWVPNLQGKTDLIPGKVNETRVQATEPGVYRGQCAEFCGVQHAFMAFLVVAQPEEDFAAWLDHQTRSAAAPENTEAKRGLEVFLTTGCGACHTVRGTSAAGDVGPDLTHVASRRTLAAGTIPNTRGHLGGWIVDPQRVKPGNRMPPSRITPADLRALLSYLDTLQ